MGGSQCPIRDSGTHFFLLLYDLGSLCLQLYIYNSSDASFGRIVLQNAVSKIVMSQPRFRVLLWEHPQIFSTSEAEQLLALRVKGPPPLREGGHLALPVFLHYLPLSYLLP